MLATALTFVLTGCGIAGGGFNRGDVITYTQKMDGSENVSSVTSNFIFTSPVDVVFAMSTPDNYMFPVAFGRYDRESGELQFKADDPVNKNVSWSYSGDLIFKFEPNSGRASVSTDNRKFAQFFDNGRVVEVVYGKKPVSISDALVGTRWSLTDESGTTELLFKTESEVEIYNIYSDGDTRTENVGYMLYDDNCIAIKSGDNISDESLVGTLLNHGQEMRVRRNGIEESRFPYIIINRK